MVDPGSWGLMWMLEGSLANIWEAARHLQNEAADAATQLVEPSDFFIVLNKKDPHIIHCKSHVCVNSFTRGL